jgi:hypothetical protein
LNPEQKNELYSVELKMDWNWISRRWFDFRMGHSTYFAFFLSFTNFLLITYNFLVSDIQFLKDIFPNMAYFVVFSALAYIPLATIVGHWHKKKQLATDITVQAYKNPFYKMILDRLDRIEEEIKKSA